MHVDDRQLRALLSSSAEAFVIPVCVSVGLSVSLFVSLCRSVVCVPVADDCLLN